MQSSAFVRRLGRETRCFDRHVRDDSREEGRLEEALLRREEKERKKREEEARLKKNEEDEWREKRKTTMKKESGHFCGRDVTPRPPLSSSSSSSSTSTTSTTTKTPDEQDEDESLRKMKEKLDALRRDKGCEDDAKRTEEKRKRRGGKDEGLVESAQKGRVAEECQEDEEEDTRD